MTHRVMACIVMAYIAMVHKVMAYVVMAHRVMAYIVMAETRAGEAVPGDGPI